MLAVVAVVVTVFSLGAMAPAAACTLTAVGMSAGMSYAAAHTAAGVATFTTISAAAVFNGDIAYSKVTGESLLLDTVFQGNAKLYNTGLEIVSIATGGMFLAATYGPGVCFVEGTLVLATNGSIAIEEIEVGDIVWSENPETGEKELKEVVQTFVNETDELVHVHVNGEEIILTPEHPFYVPKKGWIGAIDLRAGDILVLQSGEYVVVELIQHEILESPITVYNFEVEDFHTYYVSNSAVLVHNACGQRNTPDQDALIKIAKDMKKTGLSRAEADIMWEWTEEVGLSSLKNYHPPKFDSYLGGTQLHMKINGMHINIFE